MMRVHSFEVAEDAWKDIELPTTLPVTSSSRHLDSKREQLAVLEAELQRVRNLIAEMGAVKA